MMMLTIPAMTIAATPDTAVLGDWESTGAKEHRTLTLKDDGTGLFVSDHPMGICIAPLKVESEGQFVRAFGLAEDCQRKANPVDFEFFCQQTGSDSLRCKIKSAHRPSGNTKQGVEDFVRKQRTE